MTVKMERVKTSELGKANKSARNFMERSRFAKIFLKLVGVFGVALIMSGLHAVLHVPGLLTDRI